MDDMLVSNNSVWHEISKSRAVTFATESVVGQIVPDDGGFENTNFPVF